MQTTRQKHSSMSEKIKAQVSLQAKTYAKWYKMRFLLKNTKRKTTQDQVINYFNLKKNNENLDAT